MNTKIRRKQQTIGIGHMHWAWTSYDGDSNTTGTYPDSTNSRCYYIWVWCFGLQSPSLLVFHLLRDSWVCGKYFCSVVLNIINCFPIGILCYIVIFFKHNPTTTTESASKTLCTSAATCNWQWSLVCRVPKRWYWVWDCLYWHWGQGPALWNPSVGMGQDHIFHALCQVLDLEASNDLELCF